MSRLQMHAVRPREALDKLFLAGAFGVGAGGSIFLKLWAMPMLVTALFPVGVLLLYVMACFFTRAVAIEPETVGDNCYYLGFLFTLSSLAVTLYLIHDLTGDVSTASDVIPQVVSGFGVALTSTVMGVFLRVMLMQMRPDIVARDREARRDLSHGARDFHLAIVQASRRLKEITIESAQQTAERNARLDDITERHATMTRDLLKDQAKVFETAIAEASERMATAFTTRLSAETERTAETLRAASERLAQSIGHVTLLQDESLPKLREAQEGVEAALVGWREALTTHGKLQSESGQLLAGEAKALASASRSQRTALLKGVERLSEAADAIAAPIANAVGTIEGAARRMEAASHAEADALASVARAQQAASLEAVERLAGLASALSATVEQAMANVQAAETRVEAASQAQIDTLASVAKSHEDEAVRRFDEMVSNARTLVTAIDDTARRVKEGAALEERREASSAETHDTSSSGEASAKEPTSSPEGWALRALGLGRAS